MRAADCRFYCIDPYNNKAIFKIKTIRETGLPRRYSMIKILPNTMDFILYIQNPCFELIPDRFYHMNSEFNIINYLGQNGNKGYVEVITNEYGSHLPMMKGIEENFLVCEFINAGIEIIPKGDLYRLLDKTYTTEVIDSFTINEYDSSMCLVGNNRLINPGEITYSAVISSGKLHKELPVTLIGSLVDRIDMLGGRFE